MIIRCNVGDCKKASKGKCGAGSRKRTGVPSSSTYSRRYQNVLVVQLLC